MALSKTQRSGANAPQKDLAAGWIQLQPWLALRAGTDREQMYVNAVRAMYEGYDKTSADDRGRKYLTQMKEIRRKYPDDINASLFYAIGIVSGSGKDGLGIEEKRSLSSSLSSSTIRIIPGLLTTSSMQQIPRS